MRSVYYFLAQFECIAILVLRMCIDDREAGKVQLDRCSCANGCSREPE